MSASSSITGPEMPNETTGPNSGSSMLRTATGTPGGAFFWTTNPAVSGTRTRLFSESQAASISVGPSMLRQTWARSGRSRSDSAVAFSTTSQPSSSPAAVASSSEATGWAPQSSMP